MADVAPDMALRGSLLQMRALPERIAALKERIRDGVLDIALPPKPEKGTRYLTSAPEWIGVVAGARAVGDRELERAARAALVRDSATGGSFPDRPANGGLMTLSLLATTLWGTQISLADLTRRGYRPPVGPILEDAPWPALLVSKARCEDGVALDLVVEPHAAPAGEKHALTFRTVAPGRHRLTAEGVDLIVEPDADRLATVEVTVSGRVGLRLAPVVAEDA